MEQNARPAAAITYQRPGDDTAEPLVAPVVPYGAPAQDNQSGRPLGVVLVLLPATLLDCGAVSVVQAGTVVFSPA